MSLITEIIPESNFEIFRSQIAAILASELSNQRTLVQSAIATEEAKPEPDEELIKEYQLYLESIPSVVYEERFIDPNQSELPFLNVILVRTSQNDLVTNSTQSGMARYAVESWQYGKENDEYRGDQYASRKLQRLLGACTRIIMDRHYTTLGLVDDYIGHRTAHDIIIFQPKKDDNADNNIYGKFEIDIKIHEEVPDISGLLWNRSDVDLKIGEFEKGYFWTLH